MIGLRRMLGVREDFASGPLAVNSTRQSFSQGLGSISSRELVFIYSSHRLSSVKGGNFRLARFLKLEDDCIWINNTGTKALSANEVYDVIPVTEIEGLARTEGGSQIYTFVASGADSKETSEVIHFNPYQAFICSLERSISKAKTLTNIRPVIDGEVFYSHEEYH